MTRGFEFVLDDRLGIRLPVLSREWEEYSREEQETMILEWEAIRARIPDRVKVLEEEIDRRQVQVAAEEDWDRVCELYGEIFNLASIINDLNIWQKSEPLTSDPEDGDADGISEEHTNREK
jgi:hypothetical protein